VIRLLPCVVLQCNLCFVNYQKKAAKSNVLSVRSTSRM